MVDSRKVVSRVPTEGKLAFAANYGSSLFHAQVST